jgi:hypothetical protein
LKIASRCCGMTFDLRKMAVTESARQSLEFIKTHRSHIPTYSIGEILVRKYILKKAGAGDDSRVEKMITTPLNLEKLLDFF